MNKTIYISEAEGKIWDKARRLSGGSISRVIIDGLHAYISQGEDPNILARIEKLEKRVSTLERKGNK